MRFLSDRLALHTRWWNLSRSRAACPRACEAKPPRSRVRPWIRGVRFTRHIAAWV